MISKIEMEKSMVLGELIDKISNDPILMMTYPFFNFEMLRISTSYNFLDVIQVMVNQNVSGRWTLNFCSIKKYLRRFHWGEGVNVW